MDSYEKLHSLYVINRKKFFFLLFLLFFFVQSNLDVSIEDTERWVGAETEEQAPVLPQLHKNLCKHIHFWIGAFGPCTFTPYAQSSVHALSLT